MKEMHIDYSNSDLQYERASILARDAARQNAMQDPTIMAWHSGSTVSPAFPGGNPEGWWEKYGTGNGGTFEVSVGNGDEYTFILMDAEGYETVDELPLRNLSDTQGTEYVCYSPMLQGDAPTKEACYPLDDWTADQY
jgi:hypothetical protein